MKTISFMRPANAAIRINLILLALVVAGLSVAQAAALDGQWKGFLQCGALLTNPAKSPAFNVPIAMSVSGKAVTVSRDTEKVREELNGRLGAGGVVSLSGNGYFKSGSGQSWVTQLSGKFSGNQFTASGGIYTAEGMKWRDCSVEFIQVAVAQPAASEKTVQADKPVPQATARKPALTTAEAPRAVPPPAVPVVKQSPQLAVREPVAVQSAPAAKAPPVTVALPPPSPAPAPQIVKEAEPPPGQAIAPSSVAPPTAPNVPESGSSPQLKCPLDWSALADIDSNDQNKMLYGLKASEWKKEHVDQMMRKEEECQRLSTLPDSVKQAVMVDVHRTSYPNGLKSIERRDRRIQEEIDRVKRAEQESLRREAERQRDAVEQERLRNERAAAEAARSDAAQQRLDQQAESNRQEVAERRTQSVGSLNLIVMLIIVVGVLAGFIWHKFIRLRCPQCKATNPETLSRTETDRWRGTKRVTEKHSRGTNTRHVQTTYVKVLIEYRCRTCGHVWEVENQQEL
ncbi:MAG: hypothetical protein H6R18_303 [Proteobacteria bacterium]|nr:hypothetical protein [Pseudomonadota bacterium]